MEKPELDALKYPIGRFTFAKEVTPILRDSWMKTLEEFPLKLLQLVSTIEDDQLEWRYRPDGWTIRQVIHHLADSHLNSYIRFKWALTEEEPTIKAYFEDLWAELIDSQGPIQSSLSLLDGLHERWVTLLRGMTEEQFGLGFIHPETKRRVRLDQNVGLYAWHCDHHYAHILLALENNS